MQKLCTIKLKIYRYPLFILFIVTFLVYFYKTFLRNKNLVINNFLYILYDIYIVFIPIILIIFYSFLIYFYL